MSFSLVWPGDGPSIAIFLPATCAIDGMDPMQIQHVPLLVVHGQCSGDQVLLADFCYIVLVISNSPL